eukprot:PhF_6_TR25302/c0_g1_i2/m.34924
MEERFLSYFALVLVFATSHAAFIIVTDENTLDQTFSSCNATEPPSAMRIYLAASLADQATRMFPCPASIISVLAIECAPGVVWGCSKTQCLAFMSDVRTVEISNCFFYGGGIGALDPPSTPNLTLTISNTVIDGVNSSRGLNVKGGQRVSILNTVLRNGKAPIGLHGGCAQISDLSVNLTIRNSQFYNCQAYHQGGCIHFEGNETYDHAEWVPEYALTDVALYNSSFRNCISTMNGGGGIYIGYTRTTIAIDVTVSNSSALFNGGCAHFGDTTEVTLRNINLKDCQSIAANNSGGCLSLSAVWRVNADNVTVENCVADGDGAGWRMSGCKKVQASNAVLRSCRSLQGLGGGMYMRYGGKYVMVNVTMIDVSAGYWGGAFFLAVGDSITLTNVVVWNAASPRSGCGHLQTYSTVLQNVTFSNCQSTTEEYAPVTLSVLGVPSSKSNATLSGVTITSSNGGGIGIFELTNAVLERIMVSPSTGSGLLTRNSTLIVRQTILQGATSSRWKMPENASIPELCVYIQNTPPRNATFEDFRLKSCGLTRTLTTTSASGITTKTFVSARNISDNDFVAPTPSPAARKNSKTLGGGTLSPATVYSANVGGIVVGLASTTLSHAATRNSILINAGSTTCNNLETSLQAAYAPELDKDDDDMTDERFAAMVGNLLLLSVGVLADTTVVLLKSGKERKWCSRSTIRSVMAPGITVRATVVTIGLVVNSAVMLLWTTQVSSNARGLAGFCLLLYATALCFLVYEIKRSKRELMVFKAREHHENVNFCVRFLLAENGKWEDFSKSYRYEAKFGHLVSAYFDTHQWFALMELGMTVIVGILAGVQVDNHDGVCLGLYIVIFIFDVGYIIVILAVRAHHTLKDRCFLFLMTSVSTIGICLRMLEIADVIGPSNTENMFFVLSSSLGGLYVLLGAAALLRKNDKDTNKEGNEVELTAEDSLGGVQMKANKMSSDSLESKSLESKRVFPVAKFDL